MFICALEPKGLRALFENRFVLDDLKSLGAGVALVVRDFSEERALAARLLNKLGIPASAWLLLPGDQGTWLDSTHTAQAAELYQAVKRWSEVKGLQWSAMGFGAPEPGEKTAEKRANGFAIAADLSGLVEQAHTDGFAVELIYSRCGERESWKKVLSARRGSTRVSHEADRHIRLLYPQDAAPRGLLEERADEKGSVRVVRTRVSMNLEASAQDDPKTWQEFAREVCAARQKSSAVYIFTLESCAKQGFLERLVTLDWSGQTQCAQKAAPSGVRGIQLALQKNRWLGITALVGFVGGAFLIAGKKKRKS